MTALLLLGLAWADLAGCGRGSNDLPAPVSDADVSDFCRRLQKALDAQSTPAVNLLIDWNGIFDRCMQDIDFPSELRDAFRNGCASSLAKPESLAGQLVARVSQGGDVSFLRTRRVDGQTTALFREVSAEGGLFYTEFFLARAPDGSTMATDAFFFNSGERVSEQLRWYYLEFVTASKGSRSGLAEAERAFVNSTPRRKEITRLHEEGKDREALALLDALPPELQKHRTYLMLRMVLAESLGDEAEANAILRFQEVYPHDASLPLLSISRYLFTGHFDRAMESLEQFDRSIGGDPYLAYKRADIHLNAGRSEKARDEARTAIQILPGINTPYWILVSALLKLDDHAGLLEALQSIDRRFAPEFEDLSTLPEYARFVKSPQYAEWKRYLDSKESTRNAGPPWDHP